MLLRIFKMPIISTIIFQDLWKAVILPLFSNRPDVRLLNSRIWPPLLRSRGRRNLKLKKFENVKMISDEKGKFKQDPHYRAKAYS